MTLKSPRIFFGVHSFTPYCRDSGLPFGTALVLGQSGFSLAGELATLNGGANKYPWAVEETNITAELSLTIKQYEDWMMELFLGKKPTAGTASTGEVSALTNKFGAVVDATKGVASVQATVGSETDLKFTKYVVKVVDPLADSVDVYALSNVDFARGTDKQFEDNSLKITSVPLVITDGATSVIPGFGVELIGGTLVDMAGLGTLADDTATFEVLPGNTENIKARFGGSSDSFKEFGAIVVGQQSGSGQMVELDIFRLKAVGMPLGFQEKAFSEAEITAQAFYDSAKNGVFDLRHITPQGSGAC